MTKDGLETHPDTLRVQMPDVASISGGSAEKGPRGVPRSGVARFWQQPSQGADNVPVTVVAAYALFSAVAFLMYAADKSAAEQGKWRTKESTLHTIALVGGWPGALVARRVFRHKTTKQPFRTIFWGTVVANCIALAVLACVGPTLLR